MLTLINDKIAYVYRPEADVLEVKRRYQNMYIPSDFFTTSFRWTDAFPPHMPFTLNKPCSFHVMHKETDPCVENTAVLEPPDADYLFSAKVIFIQFLVLILLLLNVENHNGFRFEELNL